MLIILLIANLFAAIVVCLVIHRIFRKPITEILQRLLADDIYKAWQKYIVFAIYVVGISGGVRIWELEKYITATPRMAPLEGGRAILELSSERWVLEVYRTIIGSLQSIAWMLLVFFLIALIAYIIVKGIELRKQPKS